MRVSLIIVTAFVAGRNDYRSGAGVLGDPVDAGGHLERPGLDDPANAESGGSDKCHAGRSLVHVDGQLHRGRSGLTHPRPDVGAAGRTVARE